MIKKIFISVLITIALCVLTGCWENSLLDRSLIFATHTTLGVELSVSPAETSGPVNMVMGYKRTEGVINPVYHSQGIETPDAEAKTFSQDGASTVETTGRRPRYRNEAYSVIAKFTGETNGKADQIASTSMSVAQWFATGEAAKTLANQPGIAGAVTGSSEIAKAAATEFRASLRGESRAVGIAVLSLIKKGLEELQKDDDLSAEIHSQAKRHVERLNSLAAYLPETYTFTRYTHPGGSGKDYHAYSAKQEGKEVNRAGFDEVVVYVTDIDESIKMYPAMLAVDGLTVDGEQPVDLKKDILRYRDSARKAREEMKGVEQDPVLIDAVEFYFNVIFGR